MRKVRIRNLRTINRTQVILDFIKSITREIKA